MSAASLDQLQDIQLPPAIGWWPPAPGWWLLACLLLALAGVTVALVRRRRRLRYRRSAGRRLAASWRDYQRSLDDRILLDELVTLVRQVLRAQAVAAPADARLQRAAAMPTIALLAHIDARSGGAMAAVPPPALAERLYRPAGAPLTAAQARALHAAVRRWLRRPGPPPC